MQASAKGSTNRIRIRAAHVITVCILVCQNAHAYLATPGQDDTEVHYFQNCPLIVAGRYLRLERTQDSLRPDRAPDKVVFEVDHVIKGELPKGVIQVAIPPRFLDRGVEEFTDRIFPKMKQGRHLLLLEECPDNEEIHRMFGLNLGLFDLSQQRLGKTQAPEREQGDWRHRLQYEYIQTIDLAPTFGSSAGREAQIIPIAMQMLWSLEFDPVIVNDRLHILSASSNATVRTAAEKWKRMLDATNREAGVSESKPESTQ